MGVSGLWPELIMCPSYLSGKRSHQRALNSEDLLSSMFLIQCWNVTVPVLKSSCLWHIWHSKFSWLWCWAPTQLGCWHPWDWVIAHEPDSESHSLTCIISHLFLYDFVFTLHAKNCVLFVYTDLDKNLQTKGILRYGFMSTWKEDETGQGSSPCEEPCE